MGGCVVCLVGLPASGKTSLAGRLCLHLMPNHPTAVVCFDDEIPWEEKQDICWKEKRGALATKVDLLLEGESKIVILDDNMYYRSMRQEYCKLARKNRAGFCQIYIQVDLETALVRNASRNNSVPERIIRDMASKMEAPDPSKYLWESRTLYVNVTVSIDLVLSFVLEALGDPLHDISPPRQAEAQVASAMHQADLALRAMVSDNIKNTCSRGKAAEEMANRRRDILAKIKSGAILLPLATSEDDVQKTYYLFLEPFFNKHK